MINIYECIFIKVMRILYFLFENLFESWRIHIWQDGHYFLQDAPEFFHFSHILYVWRIDGCIYRIWRKVAKESICSFMEERRERGTDDNRSSGKRKIGGKWKFRAMEAEKCSAVLVDRHALKKITVSSGILKEKEHTGEQIRKDTCGSQRNAARKSIDSWTLLGSLGFLNPMIFVGQFNFRNTNLAKVRKRIFVFQLESSLIWSSAVLNIFALILNNLGTLMT